MNARKEHGGQGAEGYPGPLPESPHAKHVDAIIDQLATTTQGITSAEAVSRLKQYGSNSLPQARPTSLAMIFACQFVSPLIYVLVAAAIFSIVIQEWSDAAFISGVLLINAIIGTIQEFSAQRAATALQQLVVTRSRVLRDNDTCEINAENLVPGDMLLLESGEKIPADVRLLTSHDLEVDESLLTGESVAVHKRDDNVLPADTFIGDRSNMVFAGTMVNRGRGIGVVVATALSTELGNIATEVIHGVSAKPPLLVRMQRFTHRIAIIVGLAALLMAVVSLSRGMPFAEIFMLAVALAVSVIPEGLPVALTVALAIGMRRMARRNVIIRRLIAVEALGSCTYIATDKTGTLTVNELTVRRIQFPNRDSWKVSGEGMVPAGEIIPQGKTAGREERALLERLCLSSILTNDGFLGTRDDQWTHYGDAVDVALLVMAHKAGIVKAKTISAFPEISSIPFESERLFSASLNQVGDRRCMFVKGAFEKLLPMCDTMAVPGQEIVIDVTSLEQQANELACQGYRVLAIASGEREPPPGEVFSEQHLHGLTLLGLVGMIDPLRPEAQQAVTTCREAGIEVAMVTGDHPATAFAIAKELGLAEHEDHIVTGPQLRATTSHDEIDQLTRRAHVFARVEPSQKLDIVHSLQRNGHFVAVSGDGANDAPALKAAQVGVAMGKSGTDVARETAEIIITDDNFNSIVSGVEEGRISYSNVRKVIFLLISTGAAELVLFALALFTGLPLPLLAVQLLWLNLVTNGIQDVALAFEPGEGDELRQHPRSPRESIFNRIMIERVISSALVIGIVAFYLFQTLLDWGYTVEQARNSTLLLMVLFENVHVFNCRSETLSIFRHSPLRNRILLFGTATAQLIHIGAMYTPWIRDVLDIQPVSIEHWFQLLGLALTVTLVMEAHKLYLVWCGRTGARYLCPPGGA
ncbi:MAG: HAD-IC family P-type ATPase [Thiotrichales bacterium]|nr:MAG: HAD-IC family P-type ATPase [Thiotrichales bacterium]